MRRIMYQGLRILRCETLKELNLEFDTHLHSWISALTSPKRNLVRSTKNQVLTQLIYSRSLGQDYGHQDLNPSNQCQWCDLYDAAARGNSAWTNRPAVACDDQNKCTKQDTCNAGR